MKATCISRTLVSQGCLTTSEYGNGVIGHVRSVCYVNYIEEFVSSLAERVHT